MGKVEISNSQDGPTGDTPLKSGVRLGETGDTLLPDAEGDTPTPYGEVHLLEDDGPTLPTAAEYKKAGYEVPADAKSTETPTHVVADTPTPQGEVHLLDGEVVKLKDPTDADELAEALKKKADSDSKAESSEKAVKTAPENKAVKSKVKK